MMVVIAMISLLALLALPHFDYTRIRLNGAVSTARLALLASQREAVARQHDVAVMFDQPHRALRVLFDANNNGTQDGSEEVRVVALDDGVGFGRAVAPARSIGTGTITFTHQVNGLPALTFHRNGSASEAGGFYLTSLRDLNGAGKPADDRAVEVQRATGRADSYWFDGSAWQRRDCHAAS
jgi:Tfp pilus assembly protein FimT